MLICRRLGPKIPRTAFQVSTLVVFAAQIRNILPYAGAFRTTAAHCLLDTRKRELAARRNTDKAHEAPA